MAVKKDRRMRAPGAGRHPKAPVIGEQLFQWFVDQVKTSKGRISSKMLLSMAELLADDLKAHLEDTAPSSSESKSSAEQVPKLDWCWLHRWRREYGMAPARST